MQASAQLFPLMIAFVMLGLGMTLTVDDFRRVREIPGPVSLALLCQLMLLPAICFAIAKAFNLPPALAVGLMLMAASPGGAAANFLSHLADGDLALNLTLTAINSVLSIVMLPLLLALAMAGFMGEGRWIPLQFGKFLQVLGFVAVPILVGMGVRARFPDFAQRSKKIVNTLVTLVLVLVAVIGLIKGWDSLVENFAVLGGAVLSLSVVSFTVGYIVPRALKLGRRRAIAISLEIGMHNAVLALAIAMSPTLLNNVEMGTPAVLYGITSLFVALAFIYVVNRVDAKSRG